MNLTNAINPFGTLQQKLAQLPFWVIPAFIGLVVPFIGYCLLPMAGVEVFGKLFSFDKFVKLFVLGIGLIVYLYYIRFVVRKPQFLVYFYIVLWPVVEYFNNVLLYFYSINLHLRPLLMLGVMIPCAWYALSHFRLVVQTVSYVKYFLIFFVWLTVYFFFFNSNAIDPRAGNDSVLSEASVGALQYLSYLYILLGVAVTAINVLKHPHPRQFFDNLNKALLWTTSVAALMTIIGYPFHWYSINVDGFQRAMGIFTHPNPFAHHMGILMLYLLGLYCYYQGPFQRRMPAWLLTGCIILNMVAFLLGLSKTALGVFGLCAVIIFMMNLSSPVVRKTFFKAILLMLVLVPLGIVAFQLITDQSFFDILQARIDQKESLNWRVQIWNVLLSNLDWMGVLLGNGFTSANAWVFQLTYNDRLNAQPLMLVHNGYIALLYDLGLMGYMLFAAALSLMINAMRRFFHPAVRAYQPLMPAIVAMAVYFLIVCYFDEMTYMFDAPQLFWVVSTLLFTMSLREAPQT